MLHFAQIEQAINLTKTQNIGKIFKIFYTDSKMKNDFDLSAINNEEDLKV